ncbi:MAG: UV DNA damage repair endonuclease UvsE, partial [Firmicutes bacterium]|nr:UV DNA damage repair endonuclease UvsE [Bacillota bacterium]
YVGTPITIPNITYSSTLTYTNYTKLGPELGMEKLDKVIRSNFKNLKNVLHYNLQNDISFYRLSQNLIPLATKEDVLFDYPKLYQKEFLEIGEIIQKNHMRVDSHPDQFCVLNSTKQEVIEASRRILEFHHQLFHSMGLECRMIIHGGSSTFGKKQSMIRFIHQFQKLPDDIKQEIILENDDKVFTITDILSLCEKLNIPFVLDYHHYRCNHDDEVLEDYLPRIFKTWEHTGLNPKIHFSSPKNKKEFRSHSDYIEIDSFLEFLDILKPFGQDVDIMLECKAKDDALFRLVRQIKYQTDFQFLDETTFLVK